MAKPRTGFKLTGVTAYEERIKNATAQEAAQLIVKELQDEGPAYTGEFRNAWLAVPGNGKRIPAVKETKYSSKQRRDFKFRSPEARKDIDVPKLTGRGSNGYTIGNVMNYRDIALDLVPGRYKEGKNNTAPQDWYVLFIEGGKLRDILEAATLKTAKLPKIRGFSAKNINEARSRRGLL
jgi:hypothetical protein